MRATTDGSHNEYTTTADLNAFAFTFRTEIASESAHEDAAVRAWEDMVRAAGVLRLAVSAVDRLLRRSPSTALDPELSMALIESSQSAQRALVMVSEAKHLLADRFPRLGLQHTVTDGSTAEPGSRGEGNSEMPRAAQAWTDDGVTCRALMLALAASRARRAWHAGVIDADTAMRYLDSVTSAICASPR